MGLMAAPALAHGALENWAGSAQSIALPAREISFSMTVEDRFRVRLALEGAKAETACSGSRWVYDYVHHIAAGYDGGPQMIVSIGDPPMRLPARDLSHVITIRGVHLGQTPGEVAAALLVPISDIERTSRHRQYLYLQKPVHHPGDNHTFYDLDDVVFYDGRVMSIWLAHDED